MEVSLHGRPGQMLHFTDRGSGPPLVLVHGLMITGEMFEPVVDDLARRHRVKRFARSIIGLGLKRVSKQRAAWVAGLIGGQDPRSMEVASKAALVIAGSNDNAVPTHHARILHEGIASVLSVVDGADHALIWERPDEFVRLVENFLVGSLG